MAMQNQNVNHSRDWRVDDHGRHQGWEVFPNQLHSEEYPQTPEPEGYLNPFASDTQYQCFYRVDICGYHGAGYNGNGLSAVEYNASEKTYGYRAPYTSYYHPDRSSKSQQPSREATPSNDDFDAEDQEQDQHAEPEERLESYVQGDNRQASSRNSKSRRGGKSCLSCGSQRGRGNSAGGCQKCGRLGSHTTSSQTQNTSSTKN